MQKQVFVLPVVPTRADPGLTVDDQFDIVLLCLVHNSLEIHGSAEHLTWRSPTGHCQTGSISSLVLILAVVAKGILGIALYWNVVPLKYTLKIEGSHTTLFVVCHSVFDGFERPSLGKGLVLEIDGRVLVINLHLMERVIAHALSMDNEPTLCVEVVEFIVTHIIVRRLHLVTGLSLDREGMGLRWLRELSSSKLSLLIDNDKPPVKEATLPEFAKVYLDFD